MQNTSQEPTSYIVPETNQPVGKPQGSFALHLPEANAAVLPVTPKVIIRLVLAWLAVLILANTIAMHFVGKPHLSQNSPRAYGVQMGPALPADEERQVNIQSLNHYLEGYYAKFATYPSVAQINSIEFRKADPTFKVANYRTFMDPKGDSQILATQPAKNTYFYMPVPVGCGSSKVQCSGYTIGATLDNGQLYTKHNEQ